LLIDNASGHNLSVDVTKQLTNVKIHFFLPNCTSHLQPCDAGIIKSFKAHYASQLVNFFVNQLDNENLEKLILPDVKKCVYMVVQAWRSVSENTIVNCWNKCDILSNVIDSEIDMLMRIDTSDVLHNIDYKLRLLSLKQYAYRSKDSESFINEIDDSGMGNSEELTSSEIFDIVSDRNNDTAEDVEEATTEEVEEIITLDEAKKSFQNLFKFLEAKQAFEDVNFFNHFISIEKKLEVPKNIQASLDTYFSFN